MTAITPGSGAEAVFNLLPSPLAQRFRQLYSQTIHDNHNRSEIEILNSFWREQLGQLPINTIAQRECLCQSTALNVWLQRFETMVLPVIVEYRLPTGEPNVW